MKDDSKNLNQYTKNGSEPDQFTIIGFEEKFLK